MGDSSPCSIKINDKPNVIYFFMDVPLYRDYTFSEGSFGFRPKRSAQEAIRQYREYVRTGLRYVVDIDLSKFFDRVNHDRLLARLATRIRDKRVLKLIRRFLTSGVMIGGLEEPTEEGTPQGGPLSPILSNVVLDEPCQRQINLTKSLRNADCALFVMPTIVSFSSEANGQGTE